MTVRWLRSSSVTACGRRCGAAFLSSYGIGSPPGSGLLPAYAGRAGDMRGDGRGTGGTVLCTVTEGLQIPDAVADFDVSIPQSA